MAEELHIAQGGKEEKYALLYKQVRALVEGESETSANRAHIAATIHETWKERATQVVPDVELFPGHIACSSASRSEIVVPVFNAAGDVTAVLDIDSEQLAMFDDVDRLWLEKIVNELK